MSKLTDEKRKELEELEELLNRIPKQYGGPPINRGRHNASIQALHDYSDQKYGRESSGRSPKTSKKTTYNEDNGLFAARKEAIRRIRQCDMTQKMDETLVKDRGFGDTDVQEDGLNETMVTEQDLGDTDIQENGLDKTLVKDYGLGDTLKKPKKGGKTKRCRRRGLTRSGLRRTNSRQQRSTKWLNKSRRSKSAQWSSACIQCQTVGTHLVHYKSFAVSKNGLSRKKR
jgi:hypothetical protein